MEMELNMISKDSKDKNIRDRINNVIIELKPCQSMIRQENSLWSITLVNNKIIIVLRTKTKIIKTPQIILPLR